jgi:nitrogen fixation NifU-like protein
VLEAADRKLEGYNPLCGDKVTVFLELEHDRVKNVSFQGSGCAISTASASVMTESVKGKTLAEVEALFEVFHQMVTGKPPAAGNAPELGKLAAFSGVSEFPARVKCAILAWHTLHAALQGAGDTVSTE